MKKMKLAIDAMSGDLGSAIVVKSCEAFAKENPQIELVVCGKEEELISLKDYSNIQIQDCREVISMNDSIMKIRRNKGASMNVAIDLCKNNVCDAVVSCGSTAAYYAAAMLFMPKIEGVQKCGLLASLPTVDGKGVCMCDVGANAENTPEQINDFATMGSCYVRSVKMIDRPKVALLNIGTEEKKGNDVHKEAYQLLKANPNIHFVGNIEGRDIINGTVDLIVTDGFSGNIALKTIEGVAMGIYGMLKESLMQTTRSKIAAVLAKPNLRELKHKMDYKSVGGAFMIGFEKPVIKAHGASDEVAFLNAMRLASTMVMDQSITKMKEGLKHHENG